jgi:hypothetical protein
MDCFGQINQGWVLITLTFLLLAITCLEASGSVVTRNVTLINLSRSYSIFFLRAFSELAGISLSATILSTFERFKWVMISRKGHSRARFVDFLALQESTTTLGLLFLATVPAVPSLKTRFLSLLRLIFMMFIPGVGILIMSMSKENHMSHFSHRRQEYANHDTGQVNIQLAFSSASSSQSYFGYPLQSMNASVTSEYTGFSDLFLSAGFAGFLADSQHSIDLTPESEKIKACGLNTAVQESSGCHRTYFVAGDALVIAPDLLIDSSLPEADTIFASDHRGFLLNFNTGSSSTEFNATQECRTYSSRYLGIQAGAVRLCVANSSPNELEARKLFNSASFFERS